MNQGPPPRRGPSATQEAVLTGGSALLWCAAALLLHLENQSRDPWDPPYPDETPFFLLATTAAASLLLTHTLRRRTGSPLHGVILARAVTVLAVWAALIATAITT
ncbi:hypothetical protein SAMN04487983_1004247 [Streptomyces sp. yr375]|uniref:hypothetical protein n=1 Tax=Streptomyces sp. yr375 TaxID=1761906 RepID=UPI0008D298AC|nr:hypothetical protein [Streptomyces sp. yr375]SEQ35836.1 hypothetical protein SAMN04487983_1004247 [Streptomyces sp. yr375]